MVAASLPLLPFSLSQAVLPFPNFVLSNCSAFNPLLYCAGFAVSNHLNTYTAHIQKISRHRLQPGRQIDSPLAILSETTDCWPVETYIKLP